MAYEIYRKVKIEQIYMERITPGLRTRDIGDSTNRREPYDVQMLRLSSGDKATFSDFKKHIHQGDMVSIAISDKQNVIAIINHTRNTEAKLEKKGMKWDDIGGILFFLAFPVVIGGAIFRKALMSRGWDSMTIGIAAVVVLIVLLVFRGVNKQYTESVAAFRKLKNN